jgi:hypothetical protein
MLLGPEHRLLKEARGELMKIALQSVIRLSPSAARDPISHAPHSSPSAHPLQRSTLGNFRRWDPFEDVGDPLASSFACGMSLYRSVPVGPFEMDL